MTDQDTVYRRDEKSKRILVVDDNTDAVESLALLLELEGHDVRTALDGPAALELASDFRPEAVLLDIGLPGMDGYEVARRLRDRPETREALIIAITGYGQLEDRALTKAAGFNHHLVKPVDPEELGALLT
ncbi:PAS domain-containing protein [Methylocaldum marinum]|uniref:PAS domain-containing protein n=1 Tax=Methylocaldum marinum TaxID=1432792 RepID=A0A250KT57_9GAMM|nr:response regulator [Methylocaldum marinum]BBA34873.1 PAS domain-containing protein [Methylocaldum marinum]